MGNDEDSVPVACCLVHLAECPLGTSAHLFSRLSPDIGEVLLHEVAGKVETVALVGLAIELAEIELMEVVERLDLDISSCHHTLSRCLGTPQRRAPDCCQRDIPERLSCPVKHRQGLVCQGRIDPSSLYHAVTVELRLAVADVIEDYPLAHAPAFSGCFIHAEGYTTPPSALSGPLPKRSSLPQ
jgi:hypothetical protein